MHPQQSQLPVESDFIEPQSQDLDERHAVKMFLEKTPEQAEMMFRQNFLFYQEDLTNMRAPAFRFYVLPAIKYLLSDAADGDSDAASTFCQVLESRMAEAPDAIGPIAPIIGDAVRQILARFDRFDCTPEMYGDVPARYRSLTARLDG